MDTLLKKCGDVTTAAGTMLARKDRMRLSQGERTEDYAFWTGLSGAVHEEFRRWRCNLGEFGAGWRKIFWGRRSAWPIP
jgi:hypothetical protein